MAVIDVIDVIDVSRSMLKGHKSTTPALNIVSRFLLDKTVDFFSCYKNKPFEKCQNRTRWSQWIYGPLTLSGLCD